VVSEQLVRKRRVLWAEDRGAISRASLQIYPLGRRGRELLLEMHLAG